MRRSGFSFDWNWWAVNRPHFNGWRDGPHWGFAISWGNGNSDPVWLIAFDHFKDRRVSSSTTSNKESNNG